jgi:CheY-like chemotaxis protein
MAGEPHVPHVALSVTDNGVGMDDQLRTRIFEPFFTTKEAGHGTGLGLSTVYGIVKQSGGSIEVESATGKGSTFTIYFPRIDALPDTRRPGIGPEAMGLRPTTEPPVAEVVAAPVGPAPVVPAGLTILLAEDEDPVRHLVRRVLTRAGYQVIEAENGRVALDAARAHAGDIHALVTDVIMPELTGPELAEELRADRPDLPVLFTSGYNDQGMEGSGVVSGLGIAFLQKPFVPDELTRMLAQLLEQEV